MITVIISTLIGAGIGALISVLLYVLGFCTELVNCACQIISCDWNGGDLIPAMWQGGTFFNVLIFCSICGAIIGFIFGIFAEKSSRDKALAERNAKLSEEARKQRVKWADEIKQKALSVNNTCSGNKSSNKPLVSTTYKSVAQMTEILNELTTVTEKQGRVDSLAEELSKKGGASV